MATRADIMAAAGIRPIELPDGSFIVPVVAAPVKELKG